MNNTVEHPAEEEVEAPEGEIEAYVAPRQRRRRSRHRRKSMLKRRVKLAIVSVLLVIAIIMVIKALALILADYEERRNIYSSRADCAIDYDKTTCRHVEHNQYWYGPWYRVPANQPSAGPDSTDPKYRNNRVINVERRDPKKRLMQ